MLKSARETRLTSIFWRWPWRNGYPSGAMTRTLRMHRQKFSKQKPLSNTSKLYETICPVGLSGMKTYIDCGSGVAGDMLLGALVELGLSVDELNATLHRAIPLDHWRIVVRRTERQGWPARSVIVKGDRHFGSSQRMKSVIYSSKLPQPVRSHALQILSRMIDAEKLAHRRSSK